MEALALIILAVLATALFAVVAGAYGTDSRPLDAGSWWPGSRSGDDFRRHGA